MPGRSIDRAAWADVIAQLIAQETAGNKSRFAVLVKVNYKTVLRWLAQESEVSVDSVVQVADAARISPIELLVRVGYYRPDDLSDGGARAPRDPDDEALRLILESGFPNRIKVRMIQRLEELRRRDRTREEEEVRFWIEQAGETTEDLGRRA